MKLYKEGSLRVWHVPQMPGTAFFVNVDNIIEAIKILNILADYDIFQLKNNIKQDFANMQGLEIFENGIWNEWCDEEGNTIGENLDE